VQFGELKKEKNFALPWMNHEDAYSIYSLVIRIPEKGIKYTIMLFYFYIVYNLFSCFQKDELHENVKKRKI